MEPGYRGRRIDGTVHEACSHTTFVLSPLRCARIITMYAAKNLTVIATGTPKVLKLYRR